MSRARVARRYDVCVVGSGAGGAVAAHVLASRGIDVLVVEQGAHVQPGASLLDLIPRSESARARDIAGNWVEHGYPWSACAVGGGTRFYAGVSLRLREVDFDAGDHTVAEALPPRWPFGYAELRPHYDAVARLLGVAGGDGDDPTAPPAAPPVLPAHEPTKRAAAVLDAARSLGLRPFSMPLAVNSRPYAGAPICQDLTPCADFACPSGAKGDVAVRLLEPLARQPNFELRSRLKAVRLEEGRGGRVESLECVNLDTATVESVHAKTFVVAANAVQTPALLLRSRTPTSPSGIGNGRGMVGRGLCFKVGQYLRGRSELLLEAASSTEPADGTRHVTVGISDYYGTPDCPTGLGGLVYETSPTLAGEIGDPALLRVECLLADQPLARNRVLLDDRELDSLGLPRVVMDYRPHPVDLERLAYLRERATEVLAASGVREVRAEPLDFTLGSAHLHGTCRMGDDSATTVCDPHGRVHEAENVYVADGSLMPYPGGVNPAFTIQALAHRVARHVAAGVA